VRSLLKLKAATDSLEDTLRKLREVEKMRDDLMKMIVHDLKTPLTAVLATTEMLIDGDFGPLNDEQRKMLTDAEGKAEDLLALIGDLLEVSRLEEATMTLDLQEMAPAALLKEVVSEWAIRFQQEARPRPSTRATTRRCSRPTRRLSSACWATVAECAHRLGQRDQAAPVRPPRR
jgi:signal transduction histidine kinase